ncbi:MAG: LacI family DNA-binding transcriptional regulator [Victivallaceae bacterium]|nr:LacI family DNA-binding transcriptional regulator [Victivallaceae bacterium]MDD5663696.1 LacI family DNA-binding transcriptional regulator [Victivallaceae bacterium]
MFNQRRITITEFAELVGVSTATVSRAFGDKGRISEKTRRQILKKAVEYGYRPNIHARNLTARRSDTIALFYPELSGEEPDYFLAEIMLGINRSLLPLGKRLQIHPFDRDSDSKDMNKYLDILLDGSFAGIIVLGETTGSKTLIELCRCNAIACVSIGPAPAPQFNGVWFDNDAGAFLAGKYFYDIGRKHPAFISGFSDPGKISGFKRGAAGCGNEVLIVDGGYSFRHGSLAYARVISACPETDCVLCANDVLAIGFIKAALDAGKRIPQDIAVIGYDDISPARYINPALSSIALKLYEIGEKSVQIMQRLLYGETSVPSERIECDLILRQSS